MRPPDDQQGPLYGGIEAGGTKFVCAIGRGPGEIVAETRLPTTRPAETLAAALDFFRAGPPVAALGIGSFGPLDLDRRSPTWGHLTVTPKPGWSGASLAPHMGNALGVPVAIDTDVNGAALGEARWGAGQGLRNLLYLTVGTGIGGGALVNRRPLHGLVHPEMGHIRLPHDRERDPFPGHCPYHGDCLEGLASGPAIQARWGAPGHTLPPDHPAWALEAHYLALALVNFILTLSPQRIIIGGGVMDDGRLFPPLRAAVLELLNGYVCAPALLDDIAGYIVPPGLAGRAGVLGALALAMAAA